MMSMRAFFLSLVLATTFLWAYASRGQSISPAGAALPVVPLAQGERRPVLVELFTSEGCSSCPPADALLIQLEKEQPVPGAEVIALGFHVDYWDHIGWKDRFSSSTYSQRQVEYADAFKSETVYTPQMIVDGHTQFSGGDSHRALSSVAKATGSPKVAPQISASPAGSNRIKLTFRVPAIFPLNAGDSVDLLVAIAEAHLTSQAKSGENAGRSLSHTAVVRHYRRVATIKPGKDISRDMELKLPSDWRLENCRVVAFLQERRSRVVLGAAHTSLAHLAR